MVSRTAKGGALATQLRPERFEVDTRGLRTYRFAQKWSRSRKFRLTSLLETVKTQIVANFQSVISGRNKDEKVELRAPRKGIITSNGNVDHQQLTTEQFGVDSCLPTDHGLNYLN